MDANPPKPTKFSDALGKSIIARQHYYNEEFKELRMNYERLSRFYFEKHCESCNKEWCWQQVPRNKCLKCPKIICTAYECGGIHNICPDCRSITCTICTNILSTEKTNCDACSCQICNDCIQYRTCECGTKLLLCGTCYDDYNIGFKTRYVCSNCNVCNCTVRGGLYRCTCGTEWCKKCQNENGNHC